MKSARLFIFLLPLVFCHGIFGQNTENEQKRIERLTGLAKLWGTVKYFHPYPAYREIDWDKALIETIPKVNAAKTSREYEASINHLLSFLNDKNTRVIRTETKKNETANVSTAKESARLENGVLIIEAMQISRSAPMDFNAYRQTVQKIGQMVSQAKAVIFDVRGVDYTSNESVFFIESIANEFMQATLAQMLDKNITLGTIRYRMHSGYAPQFGGTSGGYYSGFTTDTPAEISGNSKTKTLPVAVIINDKSPNVGNVLSGLQTANAAVIIQEGALSEEKGVTVYTMNMPDDLKVKIRTAELINPDGSVGFQADISTGTDAMSEALKIVAQKDFKRTANKNAMPTGFRSSKDKTYAEMEFPSAEYRLLALFKFWNVINYFFPYKDLIGEPWGNILPRYIPKFEANKTAEDYLSTVQEMVAEMDDSHGGVRVNVRKPVFYPPVSVSFIENQTVVNAVLDESAGVKVGETITAIDGEPVQKYAEKFARRLASSTPQSLQRRLHFGLLRGDENSKIRLTVRGLDGKTREVEFTRIVAGTDQRWAKIEETKKKLPVFGVLPSGYGYADLTRLQVADVPKMFDAIKDTKAVIFDMRGYPNGTAWSIAPRLTEKESVPAALFSRPILTGKDLTFGEDLRSVSYTFTQYLPSRQGDVYKGKVVMLIDENAISQSEHTALFFESATDVTFIGTPTTGANGDVTSTVLPGNLIVGFTGHNVRHADGRQLQRIGIQPDIKVAPTIRGSLIEQRDEILEAAVNFLKSK